MAEIQQPPDGSFRIEPILSLNDLPSCARDCLDDAIRVGLGCESRTESCACTPEAQRKLAIDPSLVTCLTGECSPEELLEAINIGSDLCAGVDLERTSSTTSSATTTPTGTTSQGVPLPTSSSPSPSPSSLSAGVSNSSNSGLSTGVKAGIAAGLICAVLLAALVLFILFRRRRRLKASAGARAGPNETPAGVPELGGKAAYPELDPHPSNTPDFVELDAGPYVPYASPTSTAELGAGDWTSRAHQGPGVTEAAIIASDGTGRQEQGGSSALTAVPPTQDRAETPQQTKAKHAETIAPPHNDAPAPSSSPAAMIPDSLGPEPGAEKLDELIALEEELKARRATLEQLKEVQEQQATIRDRISKIRAQREPQS